MKGKPFRREKRGRKQKRLSFFAGGLFVASFLRMLKGVAILSALASAAAFAPIATVPRTQRAGPSMQLYKDGQLQGQGVNCIPIFPRPAYLDGTIPGDMGFDPMGIGSWDVLNMNFLREAEIKHGRLAMLAFVGIMVEGAGIKFPGVAATLGNSNDIFEIHNAAVAKGSMGQILLWTGLFETLCGLPAMWQRMDGSGTPGDFGFGELTSEQTVQCLRGKFIKSSRVQRCARRPCSITLSISSFSHGHTEWAVWEHCLECAFLVPRTASLTHRACVRMQGCMRARAHSHAHRGGLGEGINGEGSAGALASAYPR